MQYQVIRVGIQIEHLVTDLGLWCTTCALSTGIRVWFTASCAGQMLLRSAVTCVECEGQNVVDA